MTLEPPDLLLYLSDHKVIVCTSCQYALQSTGISRHLKDIHHLLRSDRKPYLSYVSKLDLDKPEIVIQSTTNLKQFPIPGLPAQDGLACNRADCSHLCVTEKRMKSHWILEHGTTGRSGIDWSPAQLQTFFKGNSLRYFTKINSSKTNLDHRNILEVSVDYDEKFLLDHYVNYTSLILADESFVNDYSGSVKNIPVSVWKETIPQIAETSEFLKHGIMACAALHLAHLNPDQRQSYLITAAKHQQIATPNFRAEISNLNDDNINPILAYIHILVICSFASEQENERLLVVNPAGPEVISDWLAFLRSGCGYIHMVKPLETGSPMQSLLCNYVLPDNLPNGSDNKIVERLLSVIPSPETTGFWTYQERQIYIAAAHQLAYAFAFANEIGASMNIWVALRVWPMAETLDLFQMICDEHPGALILLAQYCSLLESLDDRWYCNGRARRLKNHIRHRLDTKWQHCID